MIVDQAVWRAGSRHELRDLSDALAEVRRSEDGFVWLSLHEPTLRELDEVSAELQLHPLAVEDVAMGNQRPKLEHFDYASIVAMKTLSWEPTPTDPNAVEVGEVQVLLGDRYVVVVTQGEAELHTSLVAEHGEMRSWDSPVHVLHAVMDYVVDEYQRVVMELEDSVVALDEAMFDPATPGLGPAISRLKREVMEARLAAGPLRPVIHRLILPEARDLALVPDPLRPYFRDVADHLEAALEAVQWYDNRLTDVFSANLAKIGVQQNEDMRRISAWVALAAVPTLVAAIYGMNFEHMPELSWRYGYPAVLLGIVLVCSALYTVLRRHHWI